MNKYLTIGLSLLPLIAIVVGMIGWMFTLRADLDTVIKAWESDDIAGVINKLEDKTLDQRDELIESDLRIIEQIDLLKESLAEMERIQSVNTNEMQTIMADHEYMGELLTELGEKQPPGERRNYGAYNY